MNTNNINIHNMEEIAQKIAGTRANEIIDNTTKRIFSWTLYSVYCNDASIRNNETLIDDTTEFDLEVFEVLLQKGYNGAAIDYLKRYDTLPKEVVSLLIHYRQDLYVMQNIEKIQGFLSREDAIFLISQHDSHEVLENSEKFQNLSLDNHLAKYIILVYRECSAIFYNLEKFTELDITVAMELNEGTTFMGSSIQKNSEKYRACLSSFDKGAQAWIVSQLAKID